jgi:hypothetical protein
VLPGAALFDIGVVEAAAEFPPTLWDSSETRLSDWVPHSQFVKVPASPACSSNN